MEKENLEKIIKNQDRLVYYSFNSFGEGILGEQDAELNIPYSNSLNEIKYDPYFLSQISTENLILLLADGIKEERTYIIENEIMKRVKNGEMIFGGNTFEKEDFFRNEI